MKRFMNKKVATIGLAAGLLLGAGGAAFAYFTGSGNGTGQAQTGSTATWSVAQTTPTPAAMYPGNGTSVVTFLVTNTGGGAQAIENVGQTVAAIVNDGATPPNIKQSGTALAGCLSGWYGVVSVGAPSVGYGTSVAAGSSTTIAVTVHMTDSGTNQDVCKGATPDVSLTVSHA
jgi:hypothetical protein